MLDLKPTLCITNIHLSGLTYLTMVHNVGFGNAYLKNDYHIDDHHVTLNLFLKVFYYMSNVLAYFLDSHEPLIIYACEVLCHLPREGENI